MPFLCFCITTKQKAADCILQSGKERIMNKVICIDIGGTAIKYGIAQTDGTLLSADETPTLASEGGKALAARVHSIASDLYGKCPEAKGIAISSAGVIDSSKKRVVFASDAIPHYKDISFEEELSDLGLPVEAENDVNCAGLSEFESGSAKEAKSALVLTIGTGIGGCFIDEGRLLNGCSYSACEVGYLPLREGAFQDVASTTALVKMVAAQKEDPVSEWNGRRIFEAAAGDDPVCKEAIDVLCERLGRGIAALCFVLNPEVVVLGGGIMAQKKVLAPKIEKAFRENSIEIIASNTEIAFAGHLNAAGMKGALVHFLDKHPEFTS